MATPGAVVGSGALVTPGGAQGPQGIQGPTGPQGPPGSGLIPHGPTHVSTDLVPFPTTTAPGLAPALPAVPTGKFLDATLNWSIPAGGVSTSRQIIASTATGSVIGGGDLSADRTLVLANDAVSPGNTMLYGTNASGVKGWYSQPATGASVNTSGSIIGNGSSGSPVQLSGDNASPGANQFYGTGSSGTKGWYAAGTVGNLTTQQSIAIDGNAAGTRPMSGNHTINLINDTATPGAYQYYGVNSASARGWMDIPFSTYNTATFSMPAAGAAVAGVTVNPAAWIQIGMIFDIGTAGKMRVTGKASSTSITLLNTGATGNAASAATIPVSQFFKFVGYVDNLDPTSSIVGAGTEDSPFKLSGDATSPGINMLYGTSGAGAKGWFAQPAGGGTVNVLNSLTGNGSSGTPLQLVGDAATPGNSMLYGTNASGTKGWYTQPSGGGGTVSVTNSITGTGASGTPLQLSGDTASPGNSMLYGTSSSGTKGWYAQPSGGGGTGGTKTYAKLTPLTAQPPAANFPGYGSSADSRAYMGFNDTTAQSTSWVDVMPESAVLTSGLIVRIFWAAVSATTGNVIWKADFDKLVSATTDSYDTAVSVTTAVPGTAGNIVTSSITITTIDSIAAGDGYFFRLTRDASNVSDTAAGDARIILVEIRSAS